HRAPPSSPARRSSDLTGYVNRRPQGWPLAFWSMVLRHSLPVVGVAAFGWSGVTIAIFFVLESWLFLTTRSAVEMTFGPGYAFDRSEEHTSELQSRENL